MARTIEQIDKEMAKVQRFVAEGIAFHSPHEIQLAKDKLVQLQKEKYEIDYEARKPFIKVIEVNRPIGNSTINIRRGGRSVAGSRTNVTKIDI